MNRASVVACLFGASLPSACTLLFDTASSSTDAGSSSSDAVENPTLLNCAAPTEGRVGYIEFPNGISEGSEATTVLYVDAIEDGPCGGGIHLETNVSQVSIAHDSSMEVSEATVRAVITLPTSGFSGQQAIVDKDDDLRNDGDVSINVVSSGEGIRFVARIQSSALGEFGSDGAILCTSELPDTGTYEVRLLVGGGSPALHFRRSEGSQWAFPFLADETEAGVSIFGTSFKCGRNLDDAAAVTLEGNSNLVEVGRHGYLLGDAQRRFDGIIHSVSIHDHHVLFE